MTATPRDSVTEPAKRLTAARMVELLLQRGSSQSSSVSLSRNAKGETQIEVVVRTDSDSDVATIEDAEKVASAVYERLRQSYPMADGTVGGGQRA